jgi:transcriptional regulator with XRE-family HTH domain
VKPAVGPLGEYIRAYRKQERWTLGGLAGRAGISKGQLHGIEHGKEINLRIKTIIALSVACETTVARIATLAAASATHQEPNHGDDA